MQLPNFTFATVDNTSALPGYVTDKYDGILGLGFRSISVGGLPTVFGALAEAGQLVLGGVDQDHFVGSFHWVDLAHASYWAVALDAVQLGTQMSVTASNG